MSPSLLLRLVTIEGVDTFKRGAGKPSPHDFQCHFFVKRTMHPALALENTLNMYPNRTRIFIIRSYRAGLLAEDPLACVPSAERIGCSYSCVVIIVVAHMFVCCHAVLVSNQYRCCVCVFTLLFFFLSFCVF